MIYQRKGFLIKELEPREILQIYKGLIRRMPKKLNATLPPPPRRSVRTVKREKPRPNANPIKEEENNGGNADSNKERIVLDSRPRKRKRAVMEEMKKKRESRTSVNNNSSEDSQSPFNNSPFDNSQSEKSLPPRKKRRGTSSGHIEDGKVLKHKGDHFNKMNNKEEVIKYWSKSCLQFMIAAYQKETVEGEKNESASLYKQTGDFFKATAREAESLFIQISSRRRKRKSQERSKKEVEEISQFCYLGMIACYLQCFRIRRLDMKNTGKEVYSIMSQHYEKSLKQKQIIPLVNEESMVTNPFEDSLKMKRGEVKKTLFFLETSNLLVSAFSVMNKAYPLSPIHRDLVSFKFDEVIDIIDDRLRKVVTE